MLKKKRILIFSAFVIVLIIGVVIVSARGGSAIPQNEFEITQDDTFTVTDTSPGGGGWYTISDFSQEEKIPILEFLAGLKGGEVLATEIDPSEVVYDYPPVLYAYKPDYRIVFFLRGASNIEVREVDLSGQIKSREKFETTEDAFQTLFNRVGITDM